MPKLPIKKRKIFKDDLNDPDRKKVWISSGSVMLNLILSGDIDNGYLRGRIVNVVGDRSSCKTLTWEELINQAWYILAKKRDKKIILVVDEPEAAFDMDWAKDLQLPVDEIIWLHSQTIDQFHANIWNQIKKNPEAYLIVYVLDSLDALSDDAERQNLIKKLNKASKKIDSNNDDSEESSEKEEKSKGSYGTGRAKSMSEFFRNLTQDINKSNCLLFIVSQTRSNIGVMFGEKNTRSGGKALDFYASQIFWLAVKEKITTKSKLVKGVKVVANCKKNKVAPAFRKVEIDVLWKYGFDNYGSVIDFLAEHDALEVTKGRIEWKDKVYFRDTFRKYLAENKKEWNEILALTQKTWDNLEDECAVDLPKKYLED